MRKSVGGWFLLSVAFAAAMPATAAPREKAKAQAPVARSGGEVPKSPPDFAAMMTFIDKLFPAQPDPEPARLTLARTAVQAMWPDGAYARMMSGMMGSMFDGAMKLKGSDLASLGGKVPGAAAAAATAAANRDLSLHDQAAAKDPYFDQRMAAIRKVLTEELGKVSIIIDPKMRDGLARAMARRFDTQQLTDVNRFFATPSGQALAAQYMQLWFDPDTIRSIFTTMPEMIKLMPDMMQKFKAANDQFPQPPKTPAKGARP